MSAPSLATPEAARYHNDQAPVQAASVKSMILSYSRESIANDAGDQVLLAVKKVTPQPWVEIQCHGGAEVVRWLIDLFTSEGATACTWQELE